MDPVAVLDPFADSKWIHLPSWIPLLTTLDSQWVQLAVLGGQVGGKGVQLTVQDGNRIHLLSRGGSKLDSSRVSKPAKGSSLLSLAAKGVQLAVLAANGCSWLPRPCQQAGMWLWQGN